MKAKIMAGALASLAALSAPAARAAPPEMGEREYRMYCASCHGVDARGNGPLAEMLAVDVPDLTRLKAANDGHFPFERVYRTIDGRTEVRGHGTREMPVWGAAFRAEALLNTNPFFDTRDAETFVAGRILAVITYLSEIQE